MANVHMTDATKQTRPKRNRKQKTPKNVVMTDAGVTERTTRNTTMKNANHREPKGKIKIVDMKNREPPSPPRKQKPKQTNKSKTKGESETESESESESETESESEIEPKFTIDDESQLWAYGKSALTAAALASVVGGVYLASNPKLRNVLRERLSDDKVHDVFN